MTLLTQERFDNILDNLPPARRKVLDLFLQGSNDSEIGLAFSPEKTEKNSRSEICNICTDFQIPIIKNKKYPPRREKLVQLFYKFKRSYLIPPLFNEWTNIGSHFYLQPGIEYFDRQEYVQAIAMFQKARNADPKDPIVQIYLNNCRACLPGKQFKIAVVVAYQNDFYRDAANNVLRGIADAQTKFNNHQSQLNQQDGLTRPLLEVIIANDRNDPKTAKRVAEILCLDLDILGVIGHHASEGSQAAIKVYEKCSMPIISSSSTSSKLKSNVFFRTVGSTKIVANTYADYIVNDLKCNNIVVCYHSENTYSQTLKDDCDQVFSNRGINIVESIPIDDPHLDLKELIKNISSNNQAKALLVLSSIVTNPVALAIARENLKLGSKKLELLFSTAMSESLTFYKGANAIENVSLISHSVPADSVYTKYAKSRWGQSNLDWRITSSYDAAQALVEALVRSAVPTRREILKELKGLKLKVEQTAGCGLEFAPDNSNRLVKYRIDRISTCD
jgi:ABC-type branched-subunit amino acid transport system substrate-binding protein